VPEDQKQLIEALETLAGHVDQNTSYLEAVRDRLDTLNDKIDLVLERGIPVERMD
jgi:hypothetical protein